MEKKVDEADGALTQQHSEETLKTVFLYGLSDNTDQQVLREYFKQFGEVDNCCVTRRSQPDQQKESGGFGLVRFNLIKGIEEVMKQRSDGKLVVDGKKVEIKLAMDHPDEKPGKVFLCGLSATTNEQYLRNFFGKFGVIDDCHVTSMLNPDQLKESRDFGSVKFNKIESVDKVMAQTINGKLDIDGTDVEIKQDDHSDEKLKTVLLYGLSDTTDEQSLRTYFRSFGEIDDCYITRTSEHNQQKRLGGFGSVRFNWIESVNEVMAQRTNGKLDIDGKDVEIRQANDVKPGNWKVLRTVRWSNPEEWNFGILKPENIFSPSMVGPMLTNWWTTPKDCTQILNNPSQLQKQVNPGQMRILWIGHATLLVQMEGINILTDPVFSDKAGPKYMMGYKRYRKPAITIQELQANNIEIHAVIISHNHYDHFDEQSIKDLNARYQNIEWFVPKGLQGLVQSLGCKKEGTVREFEWWGFHKSCGEFHLEKSGFEFHFTPAKHWSGRGTHDWYKTLWGSWVVKGPNLTFFFAGDTGYQPELFEAIREKFTTGIDVAALPIGAYEPRDMMKCQHINPEEAVKIHKQLGVELSIGIHWATFQLSTETMQQTIDDLKEAMSLYMVTEDEFITLEKDLITTYPKSDQAEGAFSTD